MQGPTASSSLASGSRPARPPLIGQARAAGYQTHLISAHPTTNMLPSFMAAFESFKQMPEVSGAPLTWQALAWLQGPRQRPFFLWLHYMDTHEAAAAPTAH